MMSQIAEELDARLKQLAPIHARYLETLVREAIARAEQSEVLAHRKDWPPGYFDRTAGALAGEEFDRPPQGEVPKRDEW